MNAPELPDRRPESVLHVCDGMLKLSVEWREGERVLKQSTLLDLTVAEAMVGSPFDALLRSFDPGAQPAVRAFFDAIRRILR